MNKYIGGYGNTNADILFVGEAPSYDEEISGRPFTGPAGRILDNCLKNSGIIRSQTWLTNVFKYMIIPQAKKGKKIPAFKRAEMAGVDVQKSIQELRYEIDQINPSVIVPLGGTALWAIFGKDQISNYRGSILSAWNRKTIPTYHPATVIHSTADFGSGYWQKYVIETDLRRILEQSKFREINRPPRNLIICKNSAQLGEFYERAKVLVKRLGRPIKLAVDIEAIDCVPVCIGLSYVKHTGISVPLWNHTPKLRISDIPFSDLAAIWYILDQILRDEDFLIVGQNFKYDQDKINRLGFTIRKLFSDTMLKAFALNPELSVSLAFNTSTFTEEPYYKDEGKEFDYTKQPIEDLLRYNALDACVTLEIDDEMDVDLDEIGQRDFYENFLMQLHDLYLHIESVGFHIDELKRAELLRKYIAWAEKLKYEIWRDTDGTYLNVNSPKQVAILLYEVLKVPRRDGTGEEVLTGLLNSKTIKKETHRQVITNILEQRRVDKTKGNYLMALPDYDGRMKTTYFVCLKTGRTSTGMLEPPIRPAFDYRDDDKKLKKKNIGAAFQVITKHGDVGGDVREMYTCANDEIIFNVDSSQAEARVVALLADDEELLKLYDTNDIHALTASWFVGGCENDWSKKLLGFEHPNRFLGKTLRHAGHLGAKAKRAATEVNTQARKYRINVNVSEAFAGIALQTFHRKSPKIQQVFHTDVIKALERGRTLVAPVPYGVNSKVGGRRVFYEQWGDDLFREAFSYLPQRSITDNTKSAALRIRKIIPQIRIAVESHDALTFIVKKKDAKDQAPILVEEMERPIRFENCSIPRRDLVIPADIEWGHNYKQLKKYKIGDEPWI